MITFVKPSGVEVEVCPSSFDTAVNLGWKPKEKPEVKQEPKKETKTHHKHKG